MGGRDDLTIPAQFNLAAALIERRLAHGDTAPAVVAGDRALTSREIVDLIHQAGNAFRALGIARDERILIVLPDSPEFIASFLGAILIGAVAVPSSTFLSTADYTSFSYTTRASLLVTTTELLARIDLPAAPHITRVLLIDAPDDGGMVRSWVRWVTAASRRCEIADTHKDEPAFWLWTSGSTGEPKAAVHLHQDAPWCCRLYAEGVLGMTAADRAYSAGKLFHAYGLGNALLFPFWTGAVSIVNAGRSLPESVFSIIDRARPTIFFGVPTLYSLLLKVQDAAQRFDLSSLRFSVSAGEPLPPDLYQQWRARFGTEILDGIGSTELLNMYICSRPGLVRPGSSGLIVPGYDVRIVDDHGAPVAHNVVGDLLVKGPSAAIMYWNRRDHTQQRMRGEWFASGDKYRVDEDGYYWYCGRSDDMLKVSGEWLSPTEIESLLCEHEAVLESAVVAWQEASGVMRPKAFVVLADGRTPSADLVAELQAFVRDRAAHYKCPRAIEFLFELPRTATGKLQRFKLRE
jgi:benzoate-CoA ligase family protein